MQDFGQGQSGAAFQAQSFAAYPLAQLALSFALGILGSTWGRFEPRAIVCFYGLTMVAATIALLRSRLMLGTLLVIMATFVAGALLASVEKSEVPGHQVKRLFSDSLISVGEPVEVTGTLERDPETAPQRLYLNLRVERIRFKASEREASGSVMLLMAVPDKSTVGDVEQLDLRYGARLRVMTRLKRADEFRNPGVSSFTEYLDRKGYDATGFIKSPLLIERLENTQVFLPLTWLYSWRRLLQTQLDSRFSKETSGVLDAALLGNRYYLSRSTSERFREGGTFHVLVISGLHITFLGGLVFAIARRFGKNRILQVLLSVTIVWGYSIAVGAESSVVRAALMFTFVALAPLTSRGASSLNALGGAALVLLVVHPGDLFDPSFQLTFVSVLAIVILGWPLLKKMADVGSWRPTRETPYPPSCTPWLRSLCECLFWSERQWKRELERTNYSYRLFKSPLAATLERLHIQRLLRYIFAATVVSVGVQLALLPFLVVYFHRLSIASLFLNIGISLMMAVVAITALAAVASAQLSLGLAAPLIGATNGLNWLMVHSVDPFARVGLASVRLPEYTGWASAVYWCYYIPLGVLVVSLSRWAPLSRATTERQPLSPNEANGIDRPLGKSKGFPGKAGISGASRKTIWLAMLAQLVATALIISHPFSSARPAGTLRIDFLDVGQGDSALVTMPDNTTLLIDGGGRPGAFRAQTTFVDEHEEEFDRETRSIGEAVVSEYLWWRGLDRVDYVLATHAHADHIDGLNDVARNFRVRAALVARNPDDDPEYLRLAETLTANGIPVRTLGAGDELRLGEVTASVLWPAPSANARLPSGNNDSIALRFQFGERAFLLTGDIEASAENAMLNNAGRLEQNIHQRLKADVVKVAHHGSKTSSTEAFITATGASYAVIPVGQTSIFGHPNSEVVERWRARGALVLTTGKSGTITFETNGRDLKLETFMKER
jgi:competence protein ComEC